MNNENFRKWKNLQSEAAEAMDTADRARGFNESAGWRLLARRALAMQQLATAFAKDDMDDPTSRN
jgi:hypothetical protein